MNINDCYCPMGCGKTLYACYDEIRCYHSDCPRPTAAHEILSEPQTDHVVQIHSGEFTLKHPLRERLDNGLFGCTLGNYLMDEKPPAFPGRYVIRAEGDNWMWERL